MKKDHAREPAKKESPKPASSKPQAAESHRPAQQETRAKTAGLKPQEIEAFRKLLLELRRRYSERVEELAEEAFTPDAGGVSASPSHLGDVGSDYYSQEVSLDLLENEREALQEINDALMRVEQGVFGLCEECGQPISKERLESIPYTRYCISCARKLEAES